MGKSALNVLCLLTLAGVFVAFASPWFFGGMVVPFDAKNHFYPMIRFLAASIAAGESPLWSPYHYAGFPMAADPQSILFTPSLWPAALFGPEPSMAFVDRIHLLHLLIVGFAAFAFARTRGFSHAAAMVTALTAMFGGAIAIRLEHVLMTVSMMWFWVALWRLECLIRDGGLWRGLLFGLALFLMLVDRNHVAFLGAFVLLTYFGSRVFSLSGQHTPRSRIGAVVSAGFGGLLAIVLLAVPLILLLELASLSNRPAFELKEASFQSLHPAALLTFPMAEYFGSLRQAGLYWGPGGMQWGGEFLQMHRGMLHIYFGILPAALIIWTGLGRGALWAPGIRYFAALTFVLTLYALGRYTPVYGFLYTWVPGVDLFRRPADAVFLIGVSVSFLSGALLDQALRREDSAVKISNTLIAMGTAAVVLFSALLLASGRDRLDTALPSLGLLIIGAVAVIIMTEVARKTPSFRGLLLVALVSLVGSDLALNTSGLRNNTRPPDNYLALENPASDPVFARLQKLTQTLDPTGVPYRVETLGLGPTVQNIGQAAGFHAVLGYNPIRLGEFEILIAPGMQNNAANKRTFGAAMTGYGSTMTNSLGLRYLALGAPIEDVDPSLGSHRFRLIETIERKGKTVYLYENPDAAPRALLLGNGEVGGDVRVTRYGQGEIRLQARTDAPARLVVHDFYYPGWVATLNGAPVAIEKEQGIFR
ncbi:MAG: hypothetical protein AAGE89_17525, partial [Pseudomonadota bacterium]